MRCRVCNDVHKEEFVCRRCVNVSPHLIIAWKIKLLLQERENGALEERINGILSATSGGESQGHDDDSDDGARDQEWQRLLQLHMDKVAHLKVKKQNVRLTQVIEQLEEKVCDKRRTVEQLATGNDRVREIQESTEGGERDIKEGIDMMRNKLDEIGKILSINRSDKFRQLNSWFMISRVQGDGNGHGNAATFVYTMMNRVRILSIKSVHTFLSLEKMRDSIHWMNKYLQLTCVVYQIDMDEIDECQDNLVVVISEIVVSIIKVCQRLNLFTSMADQCEPIINVELLLSLYDIDELMYCISRLRPLERYIGIESNADYRLHWTLPMIARYLGARVNFDADSMQPTNAGEPAGRDGVNKAGTATKANATSAGIRDTNMRSGGGNKHGRNHQDRETDQNTPGRWFVVGR